MALSLGLTDTYNCRFFLKIFHVCFNLFVFIFLVTPCLVVAVSLAFSESQLKENVNMPLAMATKCGQQKLLEIPI